MSLNDFLARLHGVERRGDQWAAKCPAHEDGRASLSVTQGADGRILLKCFAGCSSDAVVAALGLTLRDLFADNGARSAPTDDALTVALYAEERQLSPELLTALGVTTEHRNGRACLAIPYRDATGTVVATRYRTRRRFWWPRRTALVPYGLDRLATTGTDKPVLLVEGESDCHACWAHDVRAVGIPGANTWKREWARLLPAAPVYVWREPDQGGETFVTKIATDLPRVLVITPPPGVKDACDLHLKEGANFRAALAALVKTATPAVIPPKTKAKATAAAPPSGTVWPEPVDGASWLDQVRGLLTEYVVLPDGAADFLAAFALVTHCLDAFDVAPYVAVLSPAPECGKTRLLEVLELVVARAWRPVTLTGAVLFRGIEAKQPTLLLDEAEVVRHDGDAAENVLALLHAGYRRGSKAERCVGERFALVEFQVFSAKVFAAIGDLPSTLLTRCVVIRLRRRAPSEPVGRFHFKELQPLASELQARGQRFGQDNKAALAAFAAPLPVVLSDRQEEVWRPEFAVAAVVGGTWPARLEAAVHALLGSRKDSDGEQLLRDVRLIFQEHGADALTSAALVADLNALETSKWGDWHGKGLTAVGLAALLKPFDVQPTRWREGTETPRGYKRQQFADAWARYLDHGDTAPPPSDPEQSEQSSNGATNGPPESRHTAPAVPTLESAENPDGTGTVPSVPSQTGGEPLERRCSRCNRGKTHYGSDPGAGWVCGYCHPAADQAMREGTGGEPEPLRALADALDLEPLP